jgi:hypothetical protein
VFVTRMCFGKNPIAAKKLADGERFCRGRRHPISF